MSAYREGNVSMAPSNKLTTATGEKLLSKRPKDSIFYHGTASKILGAFHLIVGLLSMGLGVGAICTFASGYQIGYGIWAGFVFTLTGIIAIVTAYYRNACMVTTMLVLSVFSAMCGVAQFSLGVVATVNDRFRSTTGELSWDERYLQYDIYYTRNNPFQYLYSTYCTDSYGAFTWNGAWAPVDILLLLVGAIEVLMALGSAILCCMSFCDADRRISVTVRSAYVGRDGGSFYNEGFDTRSRVSEPTFYKVVTNK